MSHEDKAFASAAAGAVSGGAIGVTGVVAGAATEAAGATAITSGLAAVGSVVGGGMLAGVVVVAALPIIGCGMGYGLYRLLSRRPTIENHESKLAQQKGSP